jgi:hypothetical protein
MLLMTFQINAAKQITQKLQCGFMWISLIFTPDIYQRINVHKLPPALAGGYVAINAVKGASSPKNICCLYAPLAKARGNLRRNHDVQGVDCR